MCNCGHDMGNADEARALRKKAIVMVCVAASLSGIPAIFALPGHRQSVLLAMVIALQLGLLARALFVIRQRKQLLARAR